MDKVELWQTIPDFPEYEVSSLGRIYHTTTDHIMKTSETTHGDVKVSLDGLHKRRTMSVKYLVADAFVFRPYDYWNAVIVLDGNRSNLDMINLAWRPKGFAWKYMNQFKNVDPAYYENRPVINTATGVEYPNIISAAMDLGLLMEDVHRSALRLRPIVFPRQGPFEYRV